MLGIGSRKNVGIGAKYVPMRAMTGCVVLAALVAVVVLTATGSLWADVFAMPTGQTSLGFVTVGWRGNAPDTRLMHDGSARGSVGYYYGIGQFEVTAGQYCQFLNAVADADTYGLYDVNMREDGNGVISSPYACEIRRYGSSGSYFYSVPSDYANRPVNFVSWGDAARFCNWLANGQPTGAQGLGTTEDGSYFLNGATSQAALLAVTRKEGARYVIPSEDEWYKAAYYDPYRSGGPGYWLYPTQSDDQPGRDITESTNAGNNANYYGIPYPIDSGHYWTTVVGQFSLSASPWGTFDQGGNVAEWNEAIYYFDYLSEFFRGERGGSLWGTAGGMEATCRGTGAYVTGFEGFRVVDLEVPEPCSLAFLAMGTVALLDRRRCRTNW